MASLKYTLLILWFSFNNGILTEKNTNNYTKVENVEKIYIGKNYIQRITQYFIDDDAITCTGRYLPIIFKMLDENKKEIEARGLLTHDGSLTHEQENSSNCHVFNRYNINKETSVLVFDDKPQVVKNSHVHNIISNELYKKYFFSWISYKLNCYDEHKGYVSTCCMIKEGTLLTQALAIIILLFVIALRICFNRITKILLQQVMAQIQQGVIKCDTDCMVVNENRTITEQKKLRKRK